ncbi:FAD-dependent monooxygenase [Streptomyces formicae]
MTETSERVVIAGGGPTGLLLAGELALAGVQAVVLDKREGIEEFSAGMAIHSRSLDLLRLRGLADRIAPEEIFAWPRTPFGFLWLDLTEVDEREYTHAYPQWRAERLLEQWVTELGVEVRRGSEVTGFTQDASGVSVEVLGADGTYRIEGRYLVGCDGPDSTVRRIAGIPFPGGGKSYYGVLADVELTGGDHDLFESGLHETGVFGALPLRPGMTRLMTIEFDTEPDPGAGAVTTEELLASVRRVRGREVEIATTHFSYRYGGRTRLADRYRDGNVFLAGEAAHQLFISGTQGLNTGLHDAFNLGWKLAATLRGWAPPALLDTYEAERRPVGERVARHSRAQMSLMHPLAEMTPLRGMLTELTRHGSVNQHLMEATAAFGYPPEGTVPAGDPVEGEPHPLTGQPVRDVALSTAAGDSSVGALLRGGRGVLVDLTDGAPTGAWPEGWADRVDTVTARPAPEIGAAAVLIRPDGHIAWADGGSDGKGLEHALRTWFGEPAAPATGKE